MNIRVAVRAIIVNDGKLFCVKQKKRNGEVNQYWCLPGGRLEYSESIEDCMTREIEEELGITPKVGRILYIQQFKHTDFEGLEFFYEVTNTEDYLNIDLSKTSHGVYEIDEYGFIDPIKEDNVLPEFLKTINLQDLPKETQLVSYL